MCAAVTCTPGLHVCDVIWKNLNELFDQHNTFTYVISVSLYCNLKVGNSGPIFIGMERLREVE